MSAGVDWVGLKEVTTSGTRWMCVCMKQNVSIPLKSGEQIFYFPASSFLRFILGAYRIRGLVVFLGYSIQTTRTVVYIAYKILSLGWRKWTQVVSNISYLSHSELPVELDCIFDTRNTLLFLPIISSGMRLFFMSRVQIIESSSSSEVAVIGHTHDGYFSNCSIYLIIHSKVGDG